MIYSNRIIEQGLVKLPILSENLFWEIKSTNSGQAWLVVINADGSVTSFIRPLPMPDNIDNFYQINLIENVACSIRLEMFESNFLNEQDEIQAYDNMPVADVIQLFG